MRVFQVVTDSWRSRVQLLEDGCEVLKAGLVNSFPVKGVKILCCSLFLVCFEFCILMIAHITPKRMIVAHLLGKDCLDGSLQDHNDQPLVQRRELRFKLWWWDEMTTTCCNKYVWDRKRIRPGASRRASPDQLCLFHFLRDRIGQSKIFSHDYFPPRRTSCR